MQVSLTNMAAEEALQILDDASKLLHKANDMFKQV
jgi:hypothetical protein